MPGIGIGISPHFQQKKSLLSYWKKQLTRNADVVKAGGYIALSTAGGYGIASPNRWFINKNNLTRIRQSGNITKIGFGIGVKTNLTALYVQVWRKDGATYDLVGEENILGKLTANTVNLVTLDTPIAALEGDYIGIGGEASSATSSLYYYDTATNLSIWYNTNVEKPAAENYAWDSAQVQTDDILPVFVYMQAPLLVGIGDSIMSGATANTSFISDAIEWAQTSQITYQLSAINSKYVCQNMGIGSQTSANIVARFTADVVDLKPKIVVILIGVNDISNGNVLQAAYIANMTTMLDACKANNILPVICKIMPWNNGTNEQMQTRDAWMVALKALVESATYEGAVWVDFDTEMGAFREGGDVGNLWNLKLTPQYTVDGVHPTILGYAKAAEVINAAIVAKGYQLV